MARDKEIYLKLLDDMDKLKKNLETIDRRLHELIDEYDQQKADKIQEEHRQWMEDRSC